MLSSSFIFQHPACSNHVIAHACARDLVIFHLQLYMEVTGDGSFPEFSKSRLADGAQYNVIGMPAYGGGQRGVDKMLKCHVRLPL